MGRCSCGGRLHRVAQRLRPVRFVCGLCYAGWVERGGRPVRVTAFGRFGRRSR